MSEPTSTPTKNTDRVAIVGAGPAGLSVARALKTLGLDFTVFEKHDDVGGIWDVHNSGSPMYRSAHFISSKTMSGHYAYPMPEHYPDYPSNSQILGYIRNFTEDSGLYPHIRFSTSVQEVNYEDGLWQVTTSKQGEASTNPQGSSQNSSQGEASTTEAYRWLICANGTNWTPNRPSLKGEDSFDGEVIHSVDYHDADLMKGKRVLVVGAGNSGVDIACDAAFNADQAYISLRRGYHFVPKNIFGMPADVFGEQSSWMPTRLRQIVFGAMLRVLNGDLTRLGLPKPDHRVMSSHPILNSQILHYLQHGDIQAKSDIDHLSGQRVHFVDGTTQEVDLIILATGYQWRLPYLSDEFFEWKNNRPQTFLKVFNKQHPSLFINGFIETNGGAYKLFDEMAYMIAKTIQAQAEDANHAAKIQSFIEGPEPDLGGQVSYVKSDRHTGYTNTEAYRAAMKVMCRRLGWKSLSEDFYSSAATNSSVGTAELEPLSEN